MYLDTANDLLFLVLAFGVGLMTIYALVLCATSPAAPYPAYEKRTKTFWLLLTGGSCVVGVMSIVQALSGNFGLGFYSMLAAVIAGVYLADVSPAVRGGSRNG